MKKYILILFLTNSAFATDVQNNGYKNLSYQKRVLNDFAVNSSKANDVAELFSKSSLHWHKGFDKIYNNGKGVPVPKILVIKNGFEISEGNKKVSVVATTKVATFRINNREYNVPINPDLNSMYNDLQGIIDSQSNSWLRIFLFSEAQAGQPSLGLVALLGIADAAHDAWSFIKRPIDSMSSSIIKCNQQNPGSFVIENNSDKREQILEWDIKNGLNIEGKKFEASSFPKDFSEEQVDHAEKTLMSEIKAISAECKKNPGTSYSFFKTPLQKSIEGLKRGKAGNSSSR